VRGDAVHQPFRQAVFLRNIFRFCVIACAWRMAVKDMLPPRKRPRSAARQFARKAVALGLPQEILRRFRPILTVS
jgi:hypothetical protein